MLINLTQYGFIKFCIKIVKNPIANSKLPEDKS